MILEGRQAVAAPRDKVWAALNDPEVLRRCIPGCQSLVRDGDDRFAAVAEVKIGPIGARFKGDVQLSDIDAPNGYTISGKGNGGIAGTAKGQARVRLSDDGAGTLVDYTVDAEVGGRMAQLGGPIVDATARRLAAQFFAEFGAIVAGERPVETAPAAAGAVAMAPAVSPTASSAPWPWLAVAVVALVAGWLIGAAGLEYAWIVGVAALVFLAFLAGRKS